MGTKKKTITSAIEDKLDDVNEKLDSIISLLTSLSTAINAFLKAFTQYADTSNKSLETIASLLSAEAEADKQLAETIKASGAITMPSSALPTKEAKK
jgi:ABC-type transporter Mla subunit MlaD